MCISDLQMDKYRKVQKPKDAIVQDESEIRVTSQGSVSAYISYAAKVLNEGGGPKVVLKASGNALTKAVTAGEVIKRRFKGLHQLTKVTTMEIVDEYEPLEEGLDKVLDIRSLPCIEIILSLEPLDESDKGYQAPIPESLVSEFDPEQMARGRGRGDGRGRGKGKGKGKNKAWNNESDDNDGEYDEARRGGKSKSRGKAQKGRDYGRKAKGNGKNSGNGKSGAKSKGFGGPRRNAWDDWYNSWWSQWPQWW